MRMATAVKQHGRVYTPDYLVKIILLYRGGEVLARKKKFCVKEFTLLRLQFPPRGSGGRCRLVQKGFLC